MHRPRRSSAALTAVLTALLATACTSESPVAAGRVVPDVVEQARGASASVYPASAYSLVQLFPGTPASARDINNGMVVAGWVGTDAFVHNRRRRTTTRLPKGTADSAVATTITAFGAAGGYVTRPGRMPAAWPNVATLVQLKDSGEVADMNDRNEAVGWIRNAKGQQQGLFWDVNARTTALLPFPKGARWSRATGINNDRVIVGETDLGGVMWTGTPGAFTARLLRGIHPWAVDGGYGTVGDNGAGTNPTAIYGQPDSIGVFSWDASARRVNGWGVVAGVAWFFWNPFDAFVADRFGGYTTLPVAAGLYPAGATGINDCGAVSGYVVFNTSIEAVIWDPGC